MSSKLPTLKHTWQLDVNNAAAIGGSNLDCYQRSLFQLKEALIGFATFPWTVHSSSDGVNYTGDGGNILGLMTDESTNSNDGLYVGVVPADITSDTPGGSFSTSSSTFDTFSKYVVFGDAAGPLDFEYTDSFSFSAWFKTSAGGDIILGKEHSGLRRGYQLGVAVAGQVTLKLSNSFTVAVEAQTTTSGFDDGAWHHAVATYNGNGLVSGVTIYVDGSSEALTTLQDDLAGNTISTTQTFSISGIADGFTQVFDGSIDDVAVYNKELTSGEVTTIYNSGAPNDLRVSGPTANLVGYWLMGDGVVQSTPIDTWIHPSKLIWAAAPADHAWIVLQHPVRNTQICFDLRNSLGRHLAMFISFSGSYSGGDLTERPRAEDEVFVETFEQWLGPLTGSFSSWVHVWHAEDGLRTRAYVATSFGTGEGAFFLFDEIDTPSPNWEQKEIAMVAFHTGLSGGVVFDDRLLSSNAFNTTNFPDFIAAGVMSYLGGPLKDTSLPIFSMGSTVFNNSSTVETEYALVGDVAALKFIHTDPFSISCWIRSKYILTDQYIVSKRELAGNQRGYSLGVTTAGEAFYHIANTVTTNTIVVTTTDADLNDGLWHNVIISYDGGQSASGVTIYIDGVSTSFTTNTDNLSATIDTTQGFQISGRGGTSQGYVGNIDDVSVYDKELTSGEVATIYNSGEPSDLTIDGPTANLVGYWLMGDGDVFPTITDNSINSNDATCTGMETEDMPFGDTPGNPQVYVRLGFHHASSGIGSTMAIHRRAAASVPNELDTKFPTITDLSTSGNDGTATNMESTDIQSDTLGGVSTLSMLFDGVDEHIVVGDVFELSFDRTDLFSISAWFKTSATAGDPMIVSKLDHTGSNTGYELFMDNALIAASGRIGFELINTVTTNQILVLTPGGWNDNAWHHVVVTWDGDVAGGADGVFIYIDAVSQVLFDQIDNLTGVTTTTTPFQIGARDGANLPWDGNIDDVAVYDKVLSPAEVLTIFNGTIITPTDGYSPLTTSILLDGNQAIFPGEEIVFPTTVFKPERTDPFTATIWMKIDPTLAAQNGTMWSCLAGSTGWTIRVNVIETGDLYITGPRAALEDMNNRTLPSGGAPIINDAAWHLVGFTSAGNDPLTSADIEIYIDGVRMTGGQRSFSGISVTTTTINGASEMLAGNIDTQLNNFGGNLCHAANWDFELTPAQMTELYGSGVPQDLFDMSFADPVFWCALGEFDDLTSGGFIDLSGNGNHGTAAAPVDPGDFVSDVPDGVVGTGGSPTDLTTEGPFANLVGYWTMGDDEGSSAYPIHPISLMADYGYHGFHGFIDDIWWGSFSLANPSSSTYPNDPDSRQFAQVGEFVFPWLEDDTLPLMGGEGIVNDTFNAHFIDTSDLTGSGLVKYFQMIGIDTGNPSQPAYHSWVVIDNPDPAGALATGPDAPPFGGPLTNIVVSAEWTD